MTHSHIAPCRRVSIRLARLLVPVLILATVRPAIAQRSTSRTARAKAARLQKFRDRQTALKKQFARDLESAAKECDRSGLEKPARGLRLLAKHVQSRPVGIRTLPKKVQPKLPKTLSDVARRWRVKFRKAKSDYANGLYKLARDVIASRDRFPSYAFELIHETAYYDSDHAAVRRMLGYVRSGDVWLTHFEKKKQLDGEVWHDKFGWLPKAHVKNYEMGLEYYVPPGGVKGTWKKADVVAALRRRFRNGWRIKTENYEVVTNHSLQEGVRVAKKLEEFHRHFFRIFAGFFNTPQQMQKLFAGTAKRTFSNRRYRVHYYRDKKEYLTQLKSFYPPSQLGQTSGLYLTDQDRRHPGRKNGRVAHFFHNPNYDNTPTLYHEATHQIFYESLTSRRTIAERRDFWIIEGISCYIESFKIKDDIVTLGDPRYPRFVAAKFRYVNDRYYVPLARFSAMGMADFQRDRRIQANYSQASGLAKFFMEYDDGRYRDALIEHLSQLYRSSGRRAASLSQLTGVDYATLDRQYGEFIKGLPIRIPRGR